jgi:chromosome segregation protein
VSADERTLAFLRELERTDAEVGVALASLDERSREVERLGAEATTLSLRLARLPAERAAAETAQAEGERDVEERRTDYALVEAALAGAKSPDDQVAARRDEVRARDLLHSAERRAAAALAEVGRLTGEEATAGREAAALAERVREIAEALDGQPGIEPPDGDSLEELAAWSTQVRASLFVTRARLAAEREAVIRQANELGSAVLGEPLVAQSAALVARRVEESQGS